MKIALVALRTRPEAVAAARDATAWLRRRGVEVAEGDLDAPASIGAALAGATVVCVFGGDGTMLRAARARPARATAPRREPRTARFPHRHVHR